MSERPSSTHRDGATEDLSAVTTIRAGHTMGKKIISVFRMGSPMPVQVRGAVLVFPVSNVSYFRLECNCLYAGRGANFAGAKVLCWYGDSPCSADAPVSREFGCSPRFRGCDGTAHDRRRPALSRMRQNRTDRPRCQPRTSTLAPSMTRIGPPAASTARMSSISFSSASSLRFASIITSTAGVDPAIACKKSSSGPGST